MDWDERSPNEQELIAHAEAEPAKKRPAGKLLRWLPKPGEPDALATEKSPPPTTGDPQRVENPTSNPPLRFQSKGIQAWGRWLMSTHRRPERGGHESDG